MHIIGWKYISDLTSTMQHTQAYIIKILHTTKIIKNCV